MRKDGTYWVPIVYRQKGAGMNSASFPHDPALVTSSGGVPFQEWEEPTQEDIRAVAKLYDAATEES